jgi:hypothetical protein
MLNTTAPQPSAPETNTAVETTETIERSELENVIGGCACCGDPRKICRGSCCTENAG